MTQQVEDIPESRKTGTRSISPPFKAARQSCARQFCQRPSIAIECEMRDTNWEVVYLLPDLLSSNPPSPLTASEMRKVRLDAAVSPE